MIEMEYRDKQSKGGCSASIPFAEYICVRKKRQKGDYELLVKSHQTPPYRMNFNGKKIVSVECNEAVLVMVSEKKAKCDGPQVIYPVGKTITYCWF